MIKRTVAPSHRQAIMADLSVRLKDVSPQFGKTVLMKLMYLLQEVYKAPLGYRFSFYTYGPYSPEVIQDLDRARARGGVDVTYIPGEPGGFQISPGANSVKLLGEANELLSKFDLDLKTLVSTFGQFNAKSLELRSTIVYLSKNMATADCSEVASLIRVVKQLKPHFSESEIESALMELRQNKIIVDAIA